MSDLKQACIEVAAKAMAGRYELSPEEQVSNIFAYGASDPNFLEVIKSKDAKVQAELKTQIKYICSLGLDTAKGRKLVYVRTRGLNTAPRGQAKVWLTMPDISESYHALIHIMVRSEALKNVTVMHTFENYQIEYTGNINDVPIVKSWLTSPQDRGVYTGCFVTLYLSDETIQTSYHHAADINRTHKQKSKSADTWNTFYEAMTAKSAIMEALRYIPVFDDQVAAMVEHYDDSHDYESQDTPNPETIDEDQLNTLLDFAAEKKIMESAVCAEFRIKTLDELPLEYYKTAGAWIKKQGENNA